MTTEQAYLGNEVRTGEEVTIEKLAADIVSHEAEAKRHKDAADRIKEQLRDMLDFGSHEAGNLKVTVSRPASKFDADAFTKAYPVELNAGLYKTVPDLTMVPPKLKTQFTVAGTGKPSVSVK